MAQLTEEEILFRLTEPSFQSMAVIAYDQVAEKCVSFQMTHSLKHSGVHRFICRHLTDRNAITASWSIIRSRIFL